MIMDRESIIAAGADLALKGLQLQTQLDKMIDLHPDNEEYKRMRDFLAERQAVLYNLLSNA